MSTAQHRWGTLKKVSNDKGPYKIATGNFDGKEIDFIVVDMSGMQTNPLEKSQVFLITPDGDEGRAFGLVLPPPAKRVDQQKEGEVTMINHKDGKGQFVKLDDNGNVIIKSPSGVVHINPPD